VTSEQFVFSRTHEAQTVLVAVNSSHQPVTAEVQVPDLRDSCWADLLCPSKTFTCAGGKLALPLDPNWGRVLVQK
jgi:hypothetical protein